jgi:hypothetical protein
MRSAPLVACSRSKHGGRLPQPQSTQNHARRPIPWLTPITLEPAIEHTRPGAEQRAGTTVVAILSAAQNGTSGVLAGLRTLLRVGWHEARRKPAAIGGTISTNGADSTVHSLAGRFDLATKMQLASGSPTRCRWLQRRRTVPVVESGSSIIRSGDDTVRKLRYTS